MIGTTLLHYVVEARLGQGGMGTVYRARDTVLNRTVAIKLLQATDAESMRRLLHEARAASALSHPEIVTIHAVEHQDDTAFIVMEYVEGSPLDRLIPTGGLAIDRALSYGSEIADALAAAHEAGIVHRDIKPSNVMITPAGHVKVLDFGIARRTALPNEMTRTLTLDGTLSAPGHVLGTPGYLAPEQIAGQTATAQADVFALGAVLYHMVTGAAPFRGESVWAVMDATLRHEPVAMNVIRPDTPAALARVVSRSLAKDPAARYTSAREMLDELVAVRRANAGSTEPTTARYSRAVIAVSLVLALIGLGAFAWSRVREGRLRWARETAVPEITRLLEVGDQMGAFRVAQRALAVAPDDPQVQGTWSSFTASVPIRSNPPGARVAVRSYFGDDEGWIELGATPLTARLPFGIMRWRFSKDGYEPLEISPNPFPSEVHLQAVGTSPPGMMYVPPGAFELERQHTTVNLPDYWIDIFEVTNGQFKAFVDAGGYQKQEYWTLPFVREGRTLSWREAMAEFRDATGRPSPSTWELGAYPDGQDETPVHGVSWYEAAAYAAFTGKSLPTIYHWYSASGAMGAFSEIARVSNFGTRGPVRVGSSGGIGPFGTHDMAGNVKEWTFNESTQGRRFVLGGAWYEAPYQFHDEDARSPFERGAGFGFRCMRQSTSLDARLTAPVDTLVRDPAELKPVGDDVFEAYRRAYDYDAIPLDGRVDERDESQAHWVLERVSFRAAYGEERVPVLLYLPRSAKPPYQTIVFFPGSDAVRAQSSRGPRMHLFEFLIRGGRAVAYPVYQQTYERRRTPGGLSFLREISIQRGLDLRRTVDYLESRRDIDRSRLAFYGLSLGAQLGPVYLAIEPRLRTGVLLSGGFETWEIPAETDPVHFAPRVKQPVLMVNGREDFDLPYESAQVPLFEALGTPAGDKRHAVLEGGHIPVRPQEVFREILDWLDQYLGPVVRDAGPP